MASDTFPCLWRPKLVEKDREILNDWTLQRLVCESTNALGTKRMAFSKLQYEVCFMIFYWVAMYNLDDVDKVAPHWEPTQMMISHHLSKARMLSKTCANLGADVMVSLTKKPCFAHYGSITLPTRREVLTELSMLKQSRLRPMLQSLQWDLYPEARSSRIFNPSNLECRQDTLFRCLGERGNATAAIKDIQSMLPKPVTLRLREREPVTSGTVARESNVCTHSFQMGIPTVLETISRLGAGAQQAITHLTLAGSTALARSAVDPPIFHALKSLNIRLDDQFWCVDSWCHVIGHCESLRSLTFEHPGGDESDSELECLLFEVYCPTLEHLEIRGFTFGPGDPQRPADWCLPAFLTKHQSTIRSLNLIDITPYASEDWPIFLSQLRLREFDVCLTRCVIIEPRLSGGFHHDKFSEEMDKLVKQYARPNHDYWLAPLDIGAYILS